MQSIKSNLKENTMNTMNSDLIENPSPRCPCMLVLDTSGSMAGEPINELNAGLLTFMQEVQADEFAAYSIEVGIITVGGEVTEELPFTAATSIDGFHPLSAGGMTPLGEGVTLALNRLQERKAQYKKAGVPHYQPWMVIISDGEPTDNWQAAAQQAREMSQNRKLVSLAIGVEGANLNKLGEFSSKPALRLQGLQFRAFFLWLSQSMIRVSASNSSASEVTLPPVDSWASI
jgi:uncharacterized protein YegL